VIAKAVTSYEGQVLSVSDIWELVCETDPSFNRGSLLPNDHGEGNLGACGCSRWFGGNPIFERSGHGRYLVLPRQQLSGSMHGHRSIDTAGTPAASDLASVWLLRSATFEIDAEMRRRGERSQATILGGSKGGRFISVGIPIGSAFNFSVSWSIGLDKSRDFDLGKATVHKALYWGLRCSKGPSHYEARDLHLRIREVLPNHAWETPDQFWPIWHAVHRPLEELLGDNDSGALTTKVITDYVDTLLQVRMLFNS